MSVDLLQEKIRKKKNPTMLELNAPLDGVPGHLMEGLIPAEGYERFCAGLLEALRDLIPAVRVSFLSFALLGPEGLLSLQNILKRAKSLGYYVCLDAPGIYSPQGAKATAEAAFGENPLYPCDGLVIPGYLGSDVVKAFLPCCQEGKKDIFVVARTANKSASELQDLLTGTRLVHAAAADHVNRYGAETAGKHGYTRVGILAAASAADSLKNLRAKYPRLFFLVDGLDYPNANAKNCAAAFDRFGHGAAVCSGTAITAAWKAGEGDGTDYLAQAKAAAERTKKNLTRYVTIL